MLMTLIWSLHVVSIYGKKHEEMGGIAFIALGLNRDEGRKGNEFWHKTLGIKMPNAGVPGMIFQPCQLAEHQKTKLVF